MNLTDLNTFVSVAEKGSFTQAAAALGVPKSTVSRRVARLEDQLDTALLLRKARSFSLTEHGRQLQTRCAPALREIADTERALAEASGAPRGRLRITAPLDVGSSPAFSRLLVGFRDRWPEVSVEVELTQRIVDLVEEGFDFALRPHIEEVPGGDGLMARRLGTIRLKLYASPAYLDQRGNPEHPRELKRHCCVTHYLSQLREAWPLQRGGRGRSTPYAISPQLIANDFSLLISALVAGGGIGLAPEHLAAPNLERGELAPVLPDWTTGVGGIYPAVACYKPALPLGERDRDGLLWISLEIPCASSWSWPSVVPWGRSPATA